MHALSFAEPSVSLRPTGGGWYAVPACTDEPRTAWFTRRERLPFRVRVASTDDDLQRVAHLRDDAYARHLPAALTQGLPQPDPLDREPGVAVLMAESKVDGELLGTLRIQTNRHRPLALQQSYALPAQMAQGAVRRGDTAGGGAACRKPPRQDRAAEGGLLLVRAARRALRVGDGARAAGPPVRAADVPRRRPGRRASCCWRTCSACRTG